MEDKEIREENEIQLSKGLLINIGVAIVTGIIVGSIVTKKSYNNGVQMGYSLGHIQGGFDILAKLR